MAINTGRILRVNLSSGKISTESVPEKIQQGIPDLEVFDLKEKRTVPSKLKPV